MRIIFQFNLSYSSAFIRPNITKKLLTGFSTILLKSWQWNIFGLLYMPVIRRRYKNRTWQKYSA